MKSGKKIFFNGLNELRAFAALAVLLHHIELFKSRDHINSLFHSDFSYFIRHIGKNGVYLFFVLSGFLITYLLLKEKEKNNTILFKKFYLRRVFRIWPLYYLILLVGFVLIPFLAHSFDIFQYVTYYYKIISDPGNYSFDSVLLYVFFLPNVALSLEKLVAGCSQAWSVGVEEQFYILWPVLIFVFTSKKLIRIFLLLLLFIVFTHIFFQPVLYDKLTKNISFEISVIPLIYKIVGVIPFEFMTIGAIGGYLYAYQKEKINLFSKSKYIYLLVVVSVFIFLFFPVASKYIQNIILSLIFMMLILISINDDNSMVFRNKLFSYLGSISYGIYMYHPFVLFLVFPWANKYLKSNLIGFNIFVYGLVVGLTILISHLSYKYIELGFIKYKDKKYKSL